MPAPGPFPSRPAGHAADVVRDDAARCAAAAVAVLLASTAPLARRGLPFASSGDPDARSAEAAAG